MPFKSAQCPTSADQTWPVPAGAAFFVIGSGAAYPTHTPSFADKRNHRRVFLAGPGSVATNSLSGLVFRARASLARTEIVRFLCLRSTWLTYVRSIPASYASSSCERASAFRAARTF